MRSVKSLARLSSWAQLRGGDDKENPKTDDERERQREKDKEKKIVKSGAVKKPVVKRKARGF